MQINSISASRYKTFDMCLFKYWLTYFRDDIKLKSNWGASVGSLIHDILENLVLEKDKDWVNRLYLGFSGKLLNLDSPLIWAKEDDYKNQKPKCDICPFKLDNKCRISGENLGQLSGCPKKLFEWCYNIVEKAIKKYQNEFWPKILRDSNNQIIGSEYNFSIPLSDIGVNLIGFFDLVLKHDEDTIEIVDYKSGSWTQNFDECYQDIQCKAYGFAAYKEFVDDINHKGFKFKNVMLTFDYFMNSPVTFTYPIEEMSNIEKLIINQIIKIKNTHNITRVIGNGSFNWKCKSLCDIEVCKKEWDGSFIV